MTVVKTESERESLVADRVVQTHSIIFLGLAKGLISCIVVSRKTSSSIDNCHTVIRAVDILHRLEFIVNPSCEGFSDTGF